MKKPLRKSKETFFAILTKDDPNAKVNLKQLYISQGNACYYCCKDEYVTEVTVTYFVKTDRKQ